MKTSFSGYKKLHRNLIFFSFLLVALLISVWARAEQATLAWEPNTESNLAGYKIHYGTASGRFSVQMDVKKVTTYSVTGLTPGQNYYFAVTAYDTLGKESGYSNSVVYSVPASAATVVSAAIVDTDKDGLSDKLENDTYRTNPQVGDTDGDGIPDRQEVSLWGQSWNGDIDGDGVINILDWDSDGDGFSDGEEVANKTNPGEKCSSLGLLPMEAGEVTVDHNWKKVNLGRQFLAPVVVAGGLSADGSDNAVVRIRNVTGRSFEIRVQEWECHDGSHVIEKIGYLAVEMGVHELAHNLKVEAGQFVLQGSKNFVSREFKSKEFPETPVVMASVSTLADPTAVTVRLKEISAKGFKICLQEQESKDQVHGAEMISYIAWQPSSGSFGGIRFDVDKTEQIVDHRFKKISFLEQYTAAPVFLGQMQSFYGGDTAAIRWRAKSTEGVEVRIAEETSRDRETSHVLEVVGFMAFSAAVR